MWVKFFGALDYEPVDLVIANIPQMLSGLRHVYGDDLAETLLKNEHYYLLQNGDDFIPIHPQMVTADLSGYEALLVIPDVGGDGEAIVALVAGAAFAGTTAGIIIAAVINIAISIALSLIMQLLSPTLSFDSDPSQAQKLDSSLFNGAPNIREQGGSVPICVGQCHAGGVLISAGISAEDKTL